MLKGVKIPTTLNGTVWETTQLPSTLTFHCALILRHTLSGTFTFDVSPFDVSLINLKSEVPPANFSTDNLSVTEI